MFLHTPVCRPDNVDNFNLFQNMTPLALLPFIVTWAGVFYAFFILGGVKAEGENKDYITAVASS